MLDKLDTTIDELIQENKLKVKWTEIEDLGITELVNSMFEDSPYNESIACTPMVENGVVCLNLFGGIMYGIGNEIYTFSRVYIDIDSNVIFMATSGEVFLYETNCIDAEDPRYYFEGE